ncbi:MAG: methylated-DNA--[protein]-cysteine S-methyltransferase [Capsulimonadales bacterium]|nr:methylated-DNA--[protein]-cysteine S-methyltransferase [Capsulimonadales bacterium]
MTTFYAYTESPIGRLLLTADEEALTGLYMNDSATALRTAPDAVERDDHPILAEARRQIAEYFTGSRRTFDLPLRTEGTPFQRRVWEELKAIPYGETISYGELARRIGDPNASRAVGMANGRNPISIIVPCHRVIGANQRLTGYGGGLERKATLLTLESGQCAMPSSM